MARMRMRQAIVKAMADELAADPDVIVMGEDVGAAGGVFKTSEGLLAQFGPRRVRDTPIAEMGFLGAAVGAAMTGLRPIVEIMFMDFLGVALDQLVTQAAKMRFLSAGQYSVPLVVRGSAGSGLGYAAQHSQAVEPWLLSTAGLKVAVASSPSTAYGLLRAAVRDPDPVVVIEPRSLYPTWEDFDPERVDVRLGRARTLRAGDDVTVVAAGATVAVALEAAEHCSAEVIDLLTLSPMDLDTVRQSVGRTGRLVTVEAGPRAGGWGAGLAAEIAAGCFGTLRAPVLRLTAPDVPVPYAEPLERLMTPAAADVVAQIEALLRTDSLPGLWWKDAR
ncbi:alpha-ketoacid dehydrogenase subunit beta [Dactylosporangium sp. CA-092794]|uniref:alpha-ketoacid dehydrogenase subunit beta n=1 Tax=Dactylosporangium sp. CA-092794 TaxID=3239929 RepID=UPI003D8F4B0F